MNRRTTSLAVLLAFALTGCAQTCAERYEPFLKQVQENLELDLKPKLEAALKAAKRDPALVANDLDLLDATIDSIKRARQAGDPIPPKAAPR